MIWVSGQELWKIRKENILLTLLLSFFFVGCDLHYNRGAYGIGVRSLSSLGAEDAYISCSYGWNLANYNILSWNESGYRMTGGFTDPLWMYMSTTLSLLGRKNWVYPFVIRERVFGLGLPCRSSVISVVFNTDRLSLMIPWLCLVRRCKMTGHTTGCWSPERLVKYLSPLAVTSLIDWD